MDDTKTKTALLVALASALTALGWEADLFQGALLRVVGFPLLKTPELRVSGAPSEHQYLFVWNGYSAKNPETMAKRIAKHLESQAEDAKAREAAKLTVIRITRAEKAIVETALRVRRGELMGATPGTFTAEIEAVSALLAKLGSL